MPPKREKGSKAGQGKATSTEDVGNGNEPSATAITPLPGPPPNTGSTGAGAASRQYPPPPFIHELVIEGHVNSIKTYATEATLKEDLRKLQPQTRMNEEVERRVLAMYENLRNRDTAERAYRARLEEEKAAGLPPGRSKGAKDAKALFEKEKQNIAKDIQWRKTDGSRKERVSMREAEMAAQARLEDFLYYQNANNRWDRLRVLDPDKKERADAERLQRQRPYILDAESDKQYHKWLHLVLDTYDMRGVGGDAYRQGNKDALGNDGPAGLVGPNDLHLWTPRNRRLPVGLGRNPAVRTYIEPSADVIAFNPKPSEGFIDKDAHLSSVYEVRSLAFPIFEGSQEPYGADSHTLDEQAEAKDVYLPSESDDDGDLFRKAYESTGEQNVTK
ncbi:hypothetical protein T440DRAFT_547119 [Plenodomus tracheiphilus IPT5]|uniref:Uncharacterized protein n=1 Tax=Plenodomus tracheiphilus IPT5 TaxID=1408161 RepID=A0A6A7ANT6_9PLEO|nr:hypothetical protein T440DRAFT_547119 [Plenodomus tracheiphilus IPT5]